MTNYIAIIHKTFNSDYGVSFPDFPTCITVGKTIDEAKDLATEALEFHIEGMKEDGLDLPKASKLEDIKVKDFTAFFIISIKDSTKKSVRINATFEEDLLEQIDREVEKERTTRSAWFAYVAKKHLQHSKNRNLHAN